ncbi:SDR family NAD(P)-dependent oxidoreductase [Bosea sp. LjRoot9]|uniref:SDR family NAD(P)-dependent oxidoreductase n=1 Tax=Bosea sp. LjRoot9 TaxID=3342341 RepID=UPI003ECCE04B
MSVGVDGWLGLGGVLCVVTGASGGIGRAIAASLAGQGARLVLLDRDEAGLADTVAAVSEMAEGAVLALPCDITDPVAIEQAAAQSFERHGACAVLVNNAGLLRPGALASLPLAEWNALLAVNLTGYLLCAQAFGRQMRAAGRGAIIHVASIAGSHPQDRSGAYSVSKAGVVMLSRQLATEWAGEGVRSNVVSPGMVETPMSRDFYAAPGVRERRSAVVPAGRIGVPQDIADAALFLASPRASYITGQEIVVDGGYSRMLMNLIPRPGYD